MRPAIARATSPAPRPTLTPLPARSERAASGQPLAPHVQEAIERSFLVDLSSVRLHTGAYAQRSAEQLSARAFTFGSDIFLGSGEQPSDLTLIAHEAAHVVQQQTGTLQQGWSDDRSDRYEREADRAAAAVQRGARFTVHERVGSAHVQRWGEGGALDYIADKANVIPGFRMFTIVLGINPINMTRVDPSAANLLRALIEFLPGGGLITQALESSGVFDKVGAWVSQQIKTLSLIGSSIKQALMDFLKSLGLKDVADFGGVWERAKRIFTEPIDRIKNFAAGLVNDIIKFIKDAILIPLAKLAQNTPGYALLKAVLGHDPISGEEVPDDASALLGALMTLAGQDEIWQNAKNANALPRITAWFKGVKSGLVAFVRQIPALAIGAIKSLELADVIAIPLALVKVAKVFGGFAGKFIGWVGTSVWALLEIVFDVVSPGAFAYVKQTGAALKSILKNPLPFVGNLVKAAKLGFENFAGNIGTHLKTGLIEWLTGSLTGVYIPKALTLAELGQFALSVLGISWAQIRGKIVKALGANGETIMKGLETGFDIVVALVKGGVSAAWELIKDKLNDLKDTVIDGIKGFVIDTIVTKAVPKLVAMFIPGAGFISAIISIYGTIKAFIEKLSKIATVVKTFIDSIVAIAAGQIDGAAKRVESVLAGVLSLAISLLAGFLSLGNISSKIMEVVQKVRATVDKALDTAINWVVEKAKGLVGKLFGASGGAPQGDLDAAVRAVEAIVDENPSLEGVSGQFSAIKTQYKLKRLEVIRVAPDAVSIDAELNPRTREVRKLSPKQRLADCIKRGLHGKKVRIQGSGSPKRAAEQTEIALRQLRSNQNEIIKEIRSAEIQLVAQERLARARGLTELDIQKATQTPRESFEKAKAQLQGVEAGISGLEHEEKVAKKERPDLRNVRVICDNCENEIQEFDMIKDKTILEAKVSVEAVKVEQIQREQAVARKLWKDAVVVLALPAGPDVVERVQEKFRKAGVVPPAVRQY
jgi:hypothetical protein